MDTVFMSVRAVHVLLGAIWLGMAVLMALFVGPAVQDAGPGGGSVMVALVRRRLHVFIAIVAGLTVVTGLWLYWKYTNGFDPAVAAGVKARIVGLGAILGLASAILGGSVVGRSMKLAVALMTQGKIDEAARHRQRAASATRLVAVLLFVAAVCMTVGAHYL